MIALLITLIILISLLLCILLLPIYVEIDSEHSIYRIRFHRIVVLNFNSNTLKLEFFIFGRRVHPTATKKIPKKQEPGKRMTATKSLKMLRKVVGVFRSFRIIAFDVRIDTGDMQWNGILYPFALLLSSYTGKSFSINFNGNNKTRIILKNNLARIGIAFFKS